MTKCDEPIRVLQCVSNMDRAGIETMLMNFYRNIDRSKIQFDFIVNRNKPGDYDSEIKKLGGTIYTTPGLNPLKWFKYQKFMKELLLNHPEYKIIHCQNEAMGFPALYAAKKNGVNIRISHSHNTTTRHDFKWPIKVFYKSRLKSVATHFVACSHAAGKYLFGKDVYVINNAIDSEKFLYDETKRMELRKKMKLEEKFVIGHVGRFEPQKNHKFLIDVFYEYSKRNRNAMLLLVGEGTLKKDIEEKVKKLNISDKVIFTGNISNVNEMYQVMDVFILPSFHEGLPVVGIEAQASGLKCLFSKKITREVDITGNAKFIGIDNVDDWITEIDNCSQYERKNMKKKMLEQKYDIHEASKNLENMYLRLMGEKTQ